MLLMHACVASCAALTDWIYSDGLCTWSAAATTCGDGVPTTCDAKCALAFNDFFDRCSQILASQVPAATMAGFRRLHTTCTTGLPVEPLLVAGSACVSANEGTYGCTYPSATNFNPQALHDDSSCTFRPPPPPAPPPPPPAAYIDQTDTFESGSLDSTLLADGNGDHTWSSGSGGTGSSDTGPSSAHAGTKYMFTEASSQTGDDFIMRVVPYFPAGAPAHID